LILDIDQYPRQRGSPGADPARHLGALHRDEDDLADYLEMAYQAAHSLLGEGDASPYWKADPTGERPLRAARALRRNLNHLWLEGKLAQNEGEKQMAEVKNLFRAGITQPERLLELLSDRY